MDLQRYWEEINGRYLEKFEKLRVFLEENNKKFNLTAISDKKEVYIKHFLDSVAGEKFFPLNASVAEIGSGGGFPSLPLKIVREDLSFLLVESTGKKCAYLKQAVDNLEFNCVQVQNARAEELCKRELYREKYDVCEARAVARLNTLAEYCMPFVKKGGVFIAYKGDCDDEIKEGERAIKVLGGEIEKIEKYSIGDGEKRTLIVVKKISPTPVKYPRGQGRERKNPII